MQQKKLLPRLRDDLSDWQLHILKTDKAIYALFLENLTYGNPDTGEHFKNPLTAFLHSVNMCGESIHMLKANYDRYITRKRRATR